MEPNAADLAYQKIKSKILAREYFPGFQLKEVRISKEIGLTRTPVREAIIRLEREGLLRIFPNKGAFVIELTANEIENLYEVREALEGMAISLAIRRANRDEMSGLKQLLDKTDQLYQRGVVKNYEDPKLDFHLELIKLSKNDKLIFIWKQLATQLSLVRMTSSMTQKRHLKALDEHRGILKHIESGDSEKAEKLLRNHNIKSKIVFLSQFKS
jgi:DNA-binding GntR family transcriptional regulator